MRKTLRRYLLGGLVIGALVGLRADSKDEGFFGYFKQNNLTEISFTTKNQKGESVEIKSLLKKSIEGKQAKVYAEHFVEESRKKETIKSHETLESKIQLAKSVIQDVRSNIIEQKNYTTNYEYNLEREGLRKKLRESKTPQVRKEISDLINNLNDQVRNEKKNADSVQTFDELYGPKNGMMMSGDCDDFTMALTTIYYAMSDYAQSKKDEDPYYKDLATGFEHYKILGAYLVGHALNIGVTLNGSPQFEVIEPQEKKTKYEIQFTGNEILVISHNKQVIKVDKIMDIYSREFSAKVPKTYKK